MPVRPTLLHHMALVSLLLFRKNLGNLREFFGQMVYRPPWQKIARTPMALDEKLLSAMHMYQVKTASIYFFTLKIKNV